METVGFIGLGVMGLPMAGHLATAGYVVRGYSRSPETRRAARSRGVTAAGSVAEAVTDADVVITMLPDSPDVRTVALGGGGIIEHLRRGATYIDMSTISPRIAREVSQAFAEAGIRTLDAPVSGGQAGAEEASLSIMVGGETETLDASRPLLETLGRSIIHVGPAGAGQVVKAANQIAVATHLQALAEVVVFLEAQGIDVATGLEAIAGGLGGSTVISRKGPPVLAGSFTPGFRSELHDKDLGIVAEAARETNTVLPVTATVAQLMRSLVARGDGGLDHSALVQLARTMNGGAAR